MPSIQHFPSFDSSIFWFIPSFSIIHFLFSFCWNSHSIQCFLLIIHSNNSVLLIYSLVFRKSLLFINFLTTVEFFAHHLSLHIVVIVLRIRALLFGFGSHLSGLSERCFPSIRLAHVLIRMRNTPLDHSTSQHSTLIYCIMYILFLNWSLFFMFYSTILYHPSLLLSVVSLSPPSSSVSIFPVPDLVTR